MEAYLLDSRHRRKRSETAFAMAFLWLCSLQRIPSLLFRGAGSAINLLRCNVVSVENLTPYLGHANTTLTQNIPKYLEWNLAQEKSEGFFPLKYAISSFRKCPNYFFFLGFQWGVIFWIVIILNWKDPRKYFFFCFRAALLGGGGLNLRCTQWVSYKLRNDG